MVATVKVAEGIVLPLVVLPLYMVSVLFFSFHSGCFPVEEVSVSPVTESVTLTVTILEAVPADVVTVAVTVVVPMDLPVILPPLTVAILSFADFQVTALPLGVTLFTVTVEVFLALLPMSRVTELALSVSVGFWAVALSTA